MRYIKKDKMTKNEQYLNTKNDVYLNAKHSKRNKIFKIQNKTFKLRNLIKMI